KIGGLEDKIGGLEGKIDGMERDIASLKAGQENLEGKIDGLEGKIDAIGNKLDDIEAKNANRHLQIESKLNALIEDNKSIHEILGEHEVSIRTLRRRPV
ncbi:MAG: hypothetical protein HPY74_20860, partial [Firmicutes bacterium]|nr:hypothetical protein [Bacillota bacterium]